MKSHQIAGVLALSGLSATSLYAGQPPVAGPVLSDGFFNTAAGPRALDSNLPPARECVPYPFNQASSYMSGCANTATGFAALDLNQTGAANTATGAGALYGNTSGSYNTAVGMLALFHNTTGTQNTAVGAGALYSDRTGTGNVALGYQSLSGSTSSSYNVAIGYHALSNNTSTVNAGNNIAIGAATLYNNGGVNNIAIGSSALAGTASGNGNTVIGISAASGMASGNYNTVLGYGVGLPTGSNYVTSIGMTPADPAVAGTPTTYIGGIFGTVLTGTPAQVVINANGQLGVLSSSERYKTDIRPLAGADGRLADLRPVSFHLKVDPRGALQYGLIAEEVAQVYPELVIRDNAGTVQGVRYDELAPLLLTEVKDQRATITALAGELAALKAELEAVQREVRQPR